MAKNKSGYLGKSAALIQQGASIENERFKNTKDVPNQQDNNAKLFEELSNSFGARPGDRPRGAAANIFSGFTKGLAHAQRSKSIEKKEEQVSKYDNVMNYFQEANNAAIEQNQWYEKREAAKQEMLPQVMAYMDNIERLDPQSQRIMAQDMLGQYGEAIGENFKLSSIDGSNPFLMTIQSDKGQQLFDMRSVFAGDEAMQQSIAMKMPAYQMKLQEERQNKQREFKLKEDELEIKKFDKGIPGGTYGTKNQDNDNAYGSIPLETLKKTGGARALIGTVNAEMNLAKDAPIILSQLDEAEKIIKENPSLGTGWANYISKGSFTKSLLNDQTRIAYEKLEKIASRVEEAYIRAKGSSISDSERETIKKGLFQTTNKGESNEFNINSVRKELAIAQARGEFAAEELANGRIATPQAFRKYQEEQTAQNESVIVFDPATGEKQRIPANKLDAAVHAGWEAQQ